jgi:hypothetical protein
VACLPSNMRAEAAPARPGRAAAGLAVGGVRALSADFDAAMKASRLSHHRGLRRNGGMISAPLRSVVGFAIIM